MSTSFINIGSPVMEVTLDEHALPPVTVEMKGVGKAPWADTTGGMFLGRRLTWGQRDFLETVRPRIEAWLTIRNSENNRQ